MASRKCGRREILAGCQHNTFAPHVASCHKCRWCCLETQPVDSSCAARPASCPFCRPISTFSLSTRGAHGAELLLSQAHAAHKHTERGKVKKFGVVGVQTIRNTVPVLAPVRWGVPLVVPGVAWRGKALPRAWLALVHVRVRCVRACVRFIFFCCCALVAVHLKQDWLRRQSEQPSRNSVPLGGCLRPHVHGGSWSTGVRAIWPALRWHISQKCVVPQQK